jgi:hypothetical protein
MVPQRAAGERNVQVESSPGIVSIVIGIGATLLMDAWNLMLTRVAGLPSLDYCLLGRWIRHMPTAFRHASIAAAAKLPGECAAGWLAHYSIGCSLALGFVLLASSDWLARPTLMPALLYGLATVAFPLFIMQPALGMGVASSKAARPAQARAKSVATHLVFGLGLYLWALALAPLQPSVNSPMTYLSPSVVLSATSAARESAEEI